MVEVTQALAFMEQQYAQFVALAHDGRTPYRWQFRLMRYVAQEGRWPDRISVPTASGKTSVIDIHVFLNAMVGLAEDESRKEHEILSCLPLRLIPRRLALTVNRRSLVDDQFDEADELCGKIHTSESMIHYKEGLKLRAGVHDGLPHTDKPSVMNVVELRGGLAYQRDWRYYPQTCAVICATPDMFGSRLLFRGYGTSRTMRSMEAGLLAYDTVLVADEAHLSRQLLETAQQVDRIESMADYPLSEYVSPLQVVETTATPASEGAKRTSVEIEQEDLTVDTSLADRLCKPKSVVLDCTSATEKEEIQKIVDICVGMIQNQESGEYGETGNGVVGCIVNTVKKAKQVAKELSTQLKKAGISRPVASYIGPMRAYDKKKILTAMRDAMSLDASPESPCCIIGTQTLEVGVDVDFTTLITELAPASALVQRAGRVNRRGLNPQGDMYVFGVEGKRLTAKTAAPYDERDLDKALAWLEKLPRTDSELPNMSAWSVRQSILQGNYVPAEKPRRLLFQRLEPWNAENLSSTDEQLSADLRLPRLQQGSADLNLWLRDDLADDSPDIGVVVRDLPQDTNVAIALLEETEPENEELFPLRNQEQAAKLKASLEGGAIRAFLYRASNEEGQRVLPLGAADANRPDSYDGRIKTGDVIVLDASVKMFTELSSEGEVVMLDLDGKSMAKDVYNACALGKMVRYYKEADGHDGIKTAFTQAYALVNNIGDFTAEQQEQMNRDLQLICTPASEMSSDSFADANTLVLNRIMYEEDETGCKTWWVVVSLHASDSGSESDQEILSAKAKEYELLLGGPHRQEEGHQDHVAARAEALARMVGFDDDMVENLRIAGEYHDEGKIDARFQTLLYQGRKPQGQRKFRAKSRFSSRAWEQQFRNQCQLRGWRHEQRSVAEFVLACETETELRQLPEYRRQLIERLIGTSHGHGRSTFEHGTDYLLPESGGASRAQAPALNNIADDLFESGGWEALIDRTNQRYGFWGVSYMEALLRAADITCSKEGL